MTRYLYVEFITANSIFWYMRLISTICKKSMVNSELMCVYNHSVYSIQQCAANSWFSENNIIMVVVSPCASIILTHPRILLKVTPRALWCFGAFFLTSSPTRVPPKYDVPVPVTCFGSSFVWEPWRLGQFWLVRCLLLTNVG